MAGNVPLFTPPGTHARARRRAAPATSAPAGRSSPASSSAGATRSPTTTRTARPPGSRSPSGSRTWDRATRSCPAATTPSPVHRRPLTVVHSEPGNGVASRSVTIYRDQSRAFRKGTNMEDHRQDHMQTNGTEAAAEAATATGRRPVRGGPRMRRGEIRTAVLAVLTEGPGHGYDVMQNLEDKTRRRVATEPGLGLPDAPAARRRGPRALDRARRQAGVRDHRRRAGPKRPTGSSRPAARRGSSPARASAAAVRCARRSRSCTRRSSRSPTVGTPEQVERGLADRHRRPQAALPDPRRLVTHRRRRPRASGSTVDQ